MKKNKIKEKLKKQQIEKQENNKKINNQIKEISKTKINHREEIIRLAGTGVTLINQILCGGVPWGRMINIVGDSSSGKTYIAIEMIAFIKKMMKTKVKIFYDDAEDGFSFNTKQMYGFNMLPKNKKRSRTIEEFDVNLQVEMNKLEKDEFLIYVIDSFDAISTDDEVEYDARRFKALSAGKKFDEGTYGVGKAKYGSEFFRLRSNDIADKNVLLIVISQVRENIGVHMGERHRRSGGKALDFYAYACLWLANVEKHFKKNRLVGTTIKVRCKKSKVERPNRECFIDLVFDYGIDNLKTNINFLYDLKTPEGKDKLKEAAKDKTDSIYNKKKNKVNGEDEKPKKDPKMLEWDKKEFTRKQLIQYIEDNNLEEELEQRTIDKWMEIEDSISSKGRKNKWA